MDKEKIKTALVDYWHLLFKSAAENQFRIQHCSQNPDGEIKCDLIFSSYIALKNYQKKVRRMTLSLSSVITLIIVSTLVIQLILPVFKIKAATYYWTQGGAENGWELAAPGTVVSHPNSTATFDSKTEHLSAGSSLSLTSTSASWQQDSIDFNIVGGGNNVYLHEGKIYVLRPAGSVCVANYQCGSGICSTGSCQ